MYKFGVWIEEAGKGMRRASPSEVSQVVSAIPAAMKMRFDSIEDAEDYLEEMLENLPEESAILEDGILRVHDESGESVGSVSYFLGSV